MVQAVAQHQLLLENKLKLLLLLVVVAARLG